MFEDIDLNDADGLADDFEELLNAAFQDDALVLQWEQDKMQEWHWEQRH